MSRKLRPLWLLLSICAVGLLGCDAPESASSQSDIWVVDLISMGGLVAVGTPVNVTDRDGYDNQPAFLSNGHALVYSSRRGNQVDIFSFDLDSGRRQRISTTLENEYSPSVSPDGADITVVRVERDGRQRIWNFPIEGGTPHPVLETAEYVGYYAWLDENTIALSVLGDPATLEIAELSTGEIRVVRDDVGRSLQAVPGRRAVAYVDRSAVGQTSIREWDLDDEIDRLLAPTVGDGEDFAFTSEGQLLMARGTELLVFTPGSDREWSVMADFADAGIGPISRIAMSHGGDRLALVASAN